MKLEVNDFQLRKVVEIYGEWRGHRMSVMLEHAFEHVFNSVGRDRLKPYRKFLREKLDEVPVEPQELDIFAHIWAEAFLEQFVPRVFDRVRDRHKPVNEADFKIMQSNLCPEIIPDE